MINSSETTSTPLEAAEDEEEEGPFTSVIHAKACQAFGEPNTDGQLIKMGRELAKQYRETYKSDPPKHKQFTGGLYIPVNSYMERDRAMMERVVRSVMS